ncbi:MAG: PPC domain-containing protein, partial [Planctomycetota bacterium]
APLATPEAEAAGGPDTNGSSGTAEPIPGNPSTLNLAGALFAGDADFFSFTGTAGERVQATVVSQRLATATPGGMTLTLYDTDGTTILAQNDNNVGPLGGPRTDAFVDFTLPASGTYFLAVSDGTAGPYQIHWFVR